MKIYVRRRHIEKGHRDSHSRCPIALAIAEIVGGEPDIEPYAAEINGKILYLPRSARRFISRFDSGKPVKPFAFTIRA